MGRARPSLAPPRASQGAALASLLLASGPLGAEPANPPFAGLQITVEVTGNADAETLRQFRARVDDGLSNQGAVVTPQTARGSLSGRRPTGYRLSAHLTLEAQTAPGRTDLHMLKATVSGAVFALETGQRLFGTTTEVLDPGSHSPREAQRNALKRLATRLLGRLSRGLARTAAGTRYVDLTVEYEGGLATAEVDAVTSKLRTLVGRDRVRVRRRSDTRLEIGLLDVSRSSRALVQALVGDKALALSVVEATERRIQLRLVPSLRGILPVQLSFESVPALRRRFEHLIRGALGSVNFVELGDEPAAVELRVRLVRRQERTQVRLQLRRHSHPLDSARGSCSARRASPEATDVCVARVAQDMAARLRTLRARGQLGLGRRATRLRVGELRTPGLFPAFYGRYLEHSVAEIEVENTSSDPVVVTFTAEVEGLSKGPRWNPSVQLGGHERRRLPIKVQLERARVQTSSTTEIHTLRLVFTLERGRVREQMDTLRPLLSHDVHALDWRLEGGRGLLGFINGKDAALEAVAAQAMAEIRDRESPWAVPAALVAALSQLEYRDDPLSPLRPGGLDVVRFPGETLRSKGGDCDDLTVLAASLAERLGVRTRVLLTPNHVFLAVDVGLDEALATHFSSAGYILLRERNRVWLPIEVTETKDGFLASWEAASAAIGVSRGEIQKVEGFDVVASRALFPASELFSTLAAPVPDLDAPFRKLLTEASADYERRLAEALARLEGEHGRGSNALGIFLVRTGRWDEAARVFESQPGREASRNNLAALELVKGNVQGARLLFADLMRIHPRFAEARMNAALVEIVLGNTGIELTRLYDGLSPQDVGRVDKRAEAFARAVEYPTPKTTRGSREKRPAERLAAVLSGPSGLRAGRPTKGGMPRTALVFWAR